MTKNDRERGSESPSSAPNEIPPELANIVDEMLRASASGHPVDLEAFCRKNPTWSGELREVYPALTALAEFEISSTDPTRLGSLSLDSQPNDLPGTLGDFRVIQEIGRGGMGIVYEAEQISLQRRVALKVLPFAGLLDARRLKRFQNEARAAALLKHPNIVGVYSVGCDRGVHYYAMELIDGRSLAESGLKVRSTNPATTVIPNYRGVADETARVAGLSTSATTEKREYFRTLARAGIQAADALSFAHEQGIVHRDIKPSNLIVDREGTLFVADFGLASMESNENLTASGDVIGTLRYMSPEQLSGEMVDGRTDVYSLGLSLYELLLGRHAFSAEKRHDLCRCILESEPPALSKEIPAIPTDLATIIHKSISKDRDDRYSSAEQLASDLRRFLAHQPIAARKVSRIEKVIRWTKRNPVVSALATTIALLFMTISIGATLVASRAIQDARHKEFSLYARDMRLCKSSLENGERLKAEETLMKWVPAPGARRDFRGFEWYYLWRRVHHPALSWTISRQFPIYAAAFTDDGSQLVTGGKFSRRLALWDLATRHELLPESGNSTDITCLAGIDTELLLSGDRHGTVHLWNLKTLKVVERFGIDAPFGARRINNLAISPDHNLVAVGVGGEHTGCAALWDRRQRKWIKRFDDRDGPCRVAFFDANTIAITCSKSQQVEIYDCQNFEPRPGFQCAADGIDDIEVSSDKKVFVLATQSHASGKVSAQMELRDVVTRNLIRRFHLHHDRICDIAFSRDGQQVAVSSVDHDISLIDLRTFSVRFIKAAHAGKVSSVCFSPSGDMLASAGADNKVRLWDLRRLREVQENDVALKTPLAATLGMAYISDEIIASSDPQGNVVLWDSQSGDEVSRLHVDLESANITRLAVSPDHSMLAVSRGHYRPTLPSGKRNLAGKVQIFNLPDCKFVGEIDLPAGYGYSEFGFSPTASHLAIASRNRVVAIDLEKLAIVAELKPGFFSKWVGYSRDAKYLACAGAKGRVRFYDAVSFEYVKEYRVENNLCEFVDFSHDGRLFLTIGLENRIKLWEVSSGRQVLKFQEFPNFPSFAVFSADDSRILSGSIDGTIRLWHTGLGEELLSFQTHQGEWLPMGAFSPDETSIAIGCGPRSFVFFAAKKTSLEQMSVEELMDFSCDITYSSEN